MEKLRHRSLLPSFQPFGRVVSRIMIPMACIFALAILPSYLASNSNLFYYGSSEIFGNETKLGVDTETIETVFGKNDTYTLSKATLQESDGDYRYYCRSQDLPDDHGDDKKALPNAVSLKLNSGVSAEDKTAPVLDTCTVTKTTVLKETAVELHAQITETDSGIDYVKARFIGDNGRGISLTLTLVDGEYVGYVSSSRLKHEGTYVLQRIMMKDKAGNRKVAVECGNIQFTVISDLDIPVPPASEEVKE